MAMMVTRLKPLSAARPAAPAAAFLALLPAIDGCSSQPQYVYKPVQNATASVSGQLAAQYQVPPASPHGDVEVATLGVTTLEPRPGEGDRTRAMHIRMVVHNRDDSGPWQVDTRAQIGSLNDYGQSRPILASATVGQPPVVTIGSSGEATIDLYYPLPRGMQDSFEVPRFDILWNVQTADGPTASRSTFNRVSTEPPPGVYAYGIGQYEWYDPEWRSNAFSRTDPLMPLYQSPPAAAHAGR